MARLDSAGGDRLQGLGKSGMETVRAGPLGTLARAQYAALVRLRWQMFMNGLRSTKGALELGARTVVFVIYASTGAGLGVGAGVAAYMLVSHEQWEFVPILFWVILAIWQLVPVMLASFQDQFDLSSLLRFPVSFGSFFMLYLIFGLLDVSSILGGLCCLGIWVGATMARPELFAWTTLSLMGFAVFNVFLVRAIFAWIDRWLAQRKTREILTGVFLLITLSLNLLNPAFHQKRHTGHASPQGRAEEYKKTKAQFDAQYEPWLKAGNAVQEWLPPGLAAMMLMRGAEQQPGLALGSLGVLGLYVLAAGGVLSARLRAEYRGENLGEAPKPRKTATNRKITAPNLEGTARREAGGGFLEGFGPIPAVMGKELRTLLRTLPQLYAIGAPLLLVLVMSGVFLKGGPGGHVFSLAVPVCMVYAQLGFTQLFYNNLGTEGTGVQLYFLSPTPIRTVMLAKNLFHSLLFGLVALFAVILAGLRLGMPDGVVLAATAAWALFALPCNLAAGNVFSITMPYRVNPGRISRQRGSQSNTLLSMLVQLGVLAVSAAVFGLCSFFDQLWVAVPVFLVLAAGAAFAWMRVLRNSDEMANQRRDSLIATLVKTD